MINKIDILLRDEKNIFLSEDQVDKFLRLTSFSFQNTKIIPGFPTCLNIYGKRAFNVNKGYYVFSKCEWCDSKSGLDKNHNCLACGGYITVSGKEI